MVVDDDIFYLKAALFIAALQAVRTGGGAAT